MPAERQTGSAKAVGQEAEVADADEAFGQHVQKEAAQELGRAQSHHALLVAVGVILPAEGDAFSVEGQQAMIGDGDAMGVAAEIAQHLHGSAEGGLGIDDPVVAMQTPESFANCLRIGESGGRAGAAKLLAAVEAFQASEELAAKDTAEDFDGQEERIARVDPVDGGPARARRRE